MSLEKRSAGGRDPTPQPEEIAPGKQKPVFLYILILFTVAFGLILMSFFMHQRSNQQVLGELHNNVNALEELQNALDENLRLEKDLEKAQAEITDLQQELESSETQDAEKAQALLLLYQLQQEYAARDLDACRQSIATLEKDFSQYLPKDTLENGVVSPAERYQQLKSVIDADPELPED